MRKVLCGLSVLGLLMFLGAASAKAQDTGKVSIFAGYSWSTNNIDNSVENFAEDYAGATTGLQGYTGSIVYNFTNNIGLEANFDGHNGTPTAFSCTTSTAGDCVYDDDTSETYTLRQDLYTYTFGPKFTTNVGPFSLWGHVLVGAAHAHEGFTDFDCSEVEESTTCGVDFSGHAAGNGFALKTGGGLDWNHGHFGVRILEVDYVHIVANATAFADGYPETVKIPVTANNVELATGVVFNFGRR